LHRKVRVRADETVLVTAGSGGLLILLGFLTFLRSWRFAIQLAKLAGLQVITTCSAKNHDYVKGLGADHVIDYTTEVFIVTRYQN
jgi:NADPH2:quinone reductase